MSQYMITDGRLYLRKDVSGNFVPVKKQALGDTWEQRSKAQNILLNCINRNLRNRYKVIEIADEIISKPVVAEKVEKIIEPKECIVRQISNEIIEENQIISLTNNIESLTNFVQSTEHRKEMLLVALSDIDKEISDINHYIEFGGKFNAYQGWLAFNMLRNRLKKRRKIKDELQILVQLGECKINTAMLNEIKKSIGNLNTRKYQPRILKELFE